MALFPRQRTPAPPRTGAARAALLLAGALLLLCGCSIVPGGGNFFKRSFPIYGGGTIVFDFGPAGVIPQENDVVRMRLASFRTDPDLKTLRYVFAFESKIPQPPRKVLVEDITGPAPEILVEDMEPALAKNNWIGISGPKTSDDTRLGWLDEPDESARIYRFTIIGKDGRVSTLCHLCLYNWETKLMIKKSLGLGS